MKDAETTVGTTPTMNKILIHLYLLAGFFLGNAIAFSEEVSESLVIQFSRGDLSSIEQAVQDALGAEPIQGESSTPLSSPYAFGTITARGVTYSFSPRIMETDLLNGGIRLKLSLRGFNGLIRRLELNKSGSSVCTNIPVSSPNSDIPVSVVVHPKVSVDGGIFLDVSEADFDLNKNNFDVNYPETCNVLFGFNWLVKWTLPWLIESYQETISSALSKALSKGLAEGTAELSPMLTFNVTLPFEGSEIPSFNAALSTHPDRIDITAERFLFSFWTSLVIDPDSVVGFSSEGTWPSDMSFFGISWQTMNAMLKEAQAKGVIRARFRENHPALGDALSHDLWLTAFPDLHEVISESAPLELEVLGAQIYNWAADESSLVQAHLSFEDLQFRLTSNSQILADFSIDARATFGLDSTKDRLLTGSLTEIRLNHLQVVANSGVLADRASQEGLQTVARRIESALKKNPACLRDLFELKLPSIRIGRHNVIISQVQTHPAGLILPLSYVRPH